MSLKAKIEAVIYASEEPVTLAQLTGLLGEEAQAELDAIDTQQQSLALREFDPDADLSIPDQDVLNAETLDIEIFDPDALDPAPDLSSRPESSQLYREDAAERPAVDEAAPAGPTPDPKADALAAKQKDRRLRDYFRSILDQLIADYSSDNRGLEIREVAGGFRLATKPEYHDAVRGFVKSLKPPLKLSLQALETLAVIAYKQPVTAPEISEVRGVDSAGVLGSLMARKLITTSGRKQVIGRPILYKTTKDFLLRFGLKDINELPSIEEFEKMAGELNAQEEIPMDEPTSPDTSPATGQQNASRSASSLDELNAPPRPTYIQHDTPEDLMSDRSTYLEGHNREHTDPHEVDPRKGEACEGEAQAQADASSQPNSQTRSQTGSQTRSQTRSQLRAEDEEGSENEADEVVIDGRISGLPPDYTDDSPSAQEAAEQEQEQQDK